MIFNSILASCWPNYVQPVELPDLSQNRDQEFQLELASLLEEYQGKLREYVVSRECWFLNRIYFREEELTRKRIIDIANPLRGYLGGLIEKRGEFTEERLREIRKEITDKQYSNTGLTTEYLEDFGDLHVILEEAVINLEELRRRHFGFRSAII